MRECESAKRDFCEALLNPSRACIRLNYLFTVPELGIFYVLDFRYRVNFTQLSNGFFHTCLGVFGSVGVRISIEIIGSPKALYESYLKIIYLQLYYL